MIHTPILLNHSGTPGCHALAPIPLRYKVASLQFLTIDQHSCGEYDWSIDYKTTLRNNYPMKGFG